MPGSGWLAGSLAFGALVAGAGGCTPDLCTRHSECPLGYECSTEAQCVHLPDAAPPGSGDGGPAGVDAGMDPPDTPSFDAIPFPDAAADVDAKQVDPGSQTGGFDHPWEPD